MPADLLQDNDKTPDNSPITDKDDIYDLLAEDDNGTDDNESRDSKTSGDKGDRESKDKEESDDSGESEESGEGLKLVSEDEQHEEEPERTDLDEVDLIAPPRRQEILAKYPKVFKDFPYLERALYTSQKYAELFPTMDDANETISKAQILDKFEADVLTGDTSQVLRAIKESDENAFHKAVDNYLPNLAKVDQQAYVHVVGNLMKTTIMNMVTEAQRHGDNGEPLKNAALVLQQYIFGGSNFEPPKNLAKEKDTSIENERREFAKEKFKSTYDDLSARVTNTLKSTINVNLDPKSEMSDYVKRQATRDAYETLEKVIGEDKRFTAIKDRLWENVFKSNFSKQSVEAVRSAYLSKARTVLPDVIRKTRQDALKGQGKVKEDKDRRGHIPVGKASSDKKPNSTSSKGGIPKGMSSLDFLNSD